VKLSLALGVSFILDAVRSPLVFREEGLRDHSFLRDPGAVPREDLVVAQVPVDTVPATIQTLREVSIPKRMRKQNLRLGV
jgi:hypothetical protein